MPPGREAVSFSDAFGHTLKARTGIEMTSRRLNQEQLAEQLKRGMRAEGLSDEAVPKAMFASATSEAEGQLWSDNSEELMQMVQALGPRNANLSSEAFLRPFFRHLQLPTSFIRELDPELLCFVQLTSLDLSRNLLTCVSNLPNSLEIFKAYNNDIARLTCRAVPNLKFLGLGHNRIGIAGLEQIACRFAGLLSLDLSCTEVADLDEAVEHLLKLRRLKHLCFIGSPVCLLPHYRLMCLRCLPQLKVLDGVPVTDEELAAAQRLMASPVPRPRPPFLRVAIQPLHISGVRSLLNVLAEEAEKAASATEAENEGAVASAALLEAYSRGVLRLRFQLPDGSWAETSELSLEPEPAAEEAALPTKASSKASAKEAAPVPQAHAHAPWKSGHIVPPDALDKFDISALRKKSGEALNFEFDVAKNAAAASGDGLLALCQWLRGGMKLKVFCQPLAPQPPEALADEVAAPALSQSGKKPSTPQKNGRPGSQPKKAVRACASKGKVEKLEVSKELDAAGESQGNYRAAVAEPPPPPPPEVALGGTVIPTDALLWNSGTGNKLIDDVQVGSELPEFPVPMEHAVQFAHVVPLAKWLDPQLQVPEPARVGPAAGGRQRSADSGDRRQSSSSSVPHLAIRVVLYARDPNIEVPLDDPPPEVEDPKAAKARNKVKK